MSIVLICNVINYRSAVAMIRYNQHIIHLHKLPKLSRLFCKICKLSMVATDQEYKSHLRKCEINSNNLASTHSIKCEVCLKVCPNIQSYSIHKLFHKPDAPKKKWSDRKDKKGMFICETCGKEFEYQRYLRHHITRLHRLVEFLQIPSVGKLEAPNGN